MTGSPATRGIAVEQVVVYGLLTALGLGALVMALGYGFFLEESRVGPGLVPGVVGGLILLIAGWELIATLRGHRTSHDHGLAEVVAAATPDTTPGGASPESAAREGASSGDGTMSPDDGPVELPGSDGGGPGLDDVDIFGRTPKERSRQLVIVFAALVVACLLVPVLGVAVVYGVFVGFLGVPLPTGLIGIGG